MKKLSYLLVILILLISAGAVKAEPIQIWNGKFEGFIQSMDISNNVDCLSIGLKDKVFVYCGESRWDYDAVKNIRAVSVSPLGEYIAIGSSDGVIVLQDRRGKVLWTQNIESSINSISISNKGDRIGIGTNDGNFFLLDKRGDIKWKYQTVGNIKAVATSLKGDFLVIGSENGVAYFLNGDGDLLWQYQTSGRIMDVSISSAGEFLAIGSDDDHIYFLDKNGALKWKYRTLGRVAAVATSSKGDKLMALAVDPPKSNIYLLDNEGGVVWEYEPIFFADKMSFSGNGHYMLLSRVSSVHVFENKEMEAINPETTITDLPTAAISSIKETIWVRVPKILFYILLSVSIAWLTILMIRRRREMKETDDDISTIKPLKELIAEEEKEEVHEDPFLVYRTITKRFLKLGQKTFVEIKLKRKSDEVAESVSLEEVIPQGLKVVSGQTSWEGEIQGEDTKTIEYVLQGEKEGEYRLPRLSVKYLDENGEEQTAESFFDGVVVENPEVELRIKREVERRIRERKISVIEEQCLELWTFKANDEVWGVDVPTPGSYGVAGSWDKFVYAFDRDGNVLWKYQTSDRVTSVATVSYFFEDYVVAGCWDGKIYLFRKNGELVWNRQVEGAIFGITISEHATHVVAGSNNNAAYLFDIRGNQLWKYKTEGSVNRVSMSSTGLVGLSSDDKHIYLLDKRGKLKWKYKTDGLVFDVEVSPDGEYVVAGSYDHNVYVLDKEGKLVWKKPTVGNVRNIPISLKGNYVAVGAGDGKIFFYDLKGELLFIHKTVGNVRTLAVSSQGNYIIVATMDNNIHFLTYPFDPSSGRV